jgi:hypothetical protein
MNAAQALTEARMAARLGRFDVSRHFRVDRSYRNVRRIDIASALMTATVATEQSALEHKWLLTGGVDDDGDRLDLVVMFKSGVFVVTAFGE